MHWSFLPPKCYNSQNLRQIFHVTEGHICRVSNELIRRPQSRVAPCLRVEDTTGVREASSFALHP